MRSVCCLCSQNNELIDEPRIFAKSAASYLPREIVAAIKWHILDRLDKHVPRHLHWLVHSPQWGQRQHLFFANLVKSASVAMLRVCFTPAEEEAVALIQQLCNASDVRNSEQHLQVLLLDYRMLFSELHGSGGGGLPDKLFVLAELREEVKPVCAAKEEVWRDIDTGQPRLSIVKKDTADFTTVFRQRRSLLRRVPVAPKCDNEGVADEDDIQSLFTALRKA